MNETNSISTFFNGITNTTKFYYLIIIVIVIWICTIVIDVSIGHILAFFLIVGIIFISTQTINEISNATNFDLEYKFDSLGDITFQPQFLYLDADLINLYFNIKNDMYNYNPDAYINSLKATDNLLKIRGDFELQLCKTPTVPNIMKNFEVLYGQDKSIIDSFKANDINYDLSLDTSNCKDTLLNAYENYQIASSEVKLAMNEIQSMIITLPSDTPVYAFKHKEVCDRLYILLKRNLDFIYNKYQKTRKPYDNYINGYDSTVPFNEYTGLTGINDQLIQDSFEFY